MVIINWQQDLESSNSVSNDTSDDNPSYDHAPNWTPLGPITIFNYLHGTLNFLGMYLDQNFNFKFYKGGGGGGWFLC